MCSSTGCGGRRILLPSVPKHSYFISLHYQALAVGLDTGDVTALTSESRSCLLQPLDQWGMQELLKHSTKSSEHFQDNKNHAGEGRGASWHGGCQTVATLGHVLLFAPFLGQQERTVRILQKQLRSGSAPDWSGDSLCEVARAEMDGDAFLNRFLCWCVGIQKLLGNKSKDQLFPKLCNPFVHFVCLFGDQVYLLTSQDEGAGGC